jgi:hypothetical protein
VKKPKLGELAHYAEIAAAITVVISLIYVGRQVEENTAAIRSSTMQAVANSSDIALQDQAADEDLTRIRMTGNADISALTELESIRYMSFNRGQWLRMQNIYAQQKLGVLDEGFWYTYSRIICDIYSPPGVRATWSDHSGVLDPDFVKFVESCAD